MRPKIFSVDFINEWYLHYDSECHSFIVGLSDKENGFAIANTRDWTMSVCLDVEWTNCISAVTLVRVGHDDVINWVQAILRHSLPDEIVDVLNN